MPSRRRHHHRSAARPPASRLPVGTHRPGSPLCSARPGSRSTIRSASGLSQNTLSSDVDTSSDLIHLTPAATATAAAPAPPPETMSDSAPSDHFPVSVAAAKLRRQQHRIDMADAALAAPSHARSHSQQQQQQQQQRPVSRAKDKVKMHINWDIGEQQAPERDTRTPVSEVRVNTFYQYNPSRAASFSRSISSLSEQTSVAEMERHDSVRNHPFQVYQRARSRKAQDLTPFEIKPEEKQKTVEATFDKREIYEVFAGELPSLAFLGSNPGYKSGQLQFIQHPNGDVSAHIWSAARFQWENIGSFSNIRKKMEGQVAHDRLKGETASQALQRNTLAYFRTIAKQREHTSMGLPFGQDDIQQLLPQLKAQTSSCEANEDDESSQISSDTTSSRRVSGSTASFPTREIRRIVSTLQGPRSAQADRFHIPSHLQSADSNDPFTSAAFSARTYNPFGAGTAPRPAEHAIAVPLSREESLRAIMTAPPGSPTSFSLVTGARMPATDSTVKPVVVTDGNPGMLSVPSIETHASQQFPRRDSSLGSIGTPSRSKPVTPFASREAMRDHLLQLGKSAQERSANQAKIRTVLHDPFQAQSREMDEVALTSASSTNASPATARRSRPAYDGPSGIPSGRSANLPTRDRPTSSDHKPAGLLLREFSLADSVPDTDPPYNTGNPYPLDFDCPVTKSSKSWEEELDEWWTSGNKLVRQEAFYQSIAAFGNGGTSSTSTRSQGAGSARTRAIGAPPIATVAHPSDETVPPFQEDMTRILIPIYENLASYVQGPRDQRRDYWCNWSQPPEYAIDRSPNGNNSFFEDEWGKPPARIGRDPRYAPLPGELRFGGMRAGYGGAGGGVVGGSPVRGIPGWSGGGIPGLGGRFPYGAGTGGRT